MRGLPLWSSPWMVVAALLLLLGGAGNAVLIFQRLSAAQSTLGERVHEVMLWSAFQLEREVDRLEDELRVWRQRGDTPFAEAQTRMEILLSRLEYLESGDFGPGQGETMRQICQAVAVHIRRIAPLIAGLPGLADPRGTVSGIRSQLRQLRGEAGQLTLAANQLALHQREATRREAESLRDALVWTAVALLAAVVLAFAAVLAQNRALARARTRAERIGIELRHAMEEAQCAARAKSAFLSTMSHEIRTPMNAVLAAASLLGQSRLDTGQQRQLRLIDSSGKALLGLIDDVLDFSRLEAGRTRFQIAPFAPRALVESVADIIAPLLPGRPVAVLAVVAPDVPAILSSDMHQLRQVLVNLLANAVKFTETGSIVLTVSVAAEEAGLSLLAEVEDTGIGIAPRALAGLFREFEQADPGVGLRYGGTGLGLAICKRIVDGLGGRIEADSVPGVGSRFRFRVPVTADAPPPAPPPRGPAALCGLGAALGPPLAMLLRGEGYDCRGEPAAPAALALLAGDAGPPPLLPAGRLLRLDDPAVPLWPLTAGRLADALGRGGGDGDGPVASPLTALSLLVAEDIATNREVMEQLLAHLGHRVALVRNGAEALAAVEDGRFDAALVDLRMPVLDGLATARAIRALPGAAGRLPLLAVSANVLDSDLAEARAAGFDAFLPKPITLARLDAALGRLLGREAAAMPAPPHGAVDAAQRQALQAAMRPGSLERLIAAFWAEVPERLAALASAEDPAAVREVLHALSGAAGMLGYADVAAAAGRGGASLHVVLAAAVHADAAMLDAATLVGVRAALQ